MKSRLFVAILHRGIAAVVAFLIISPPSADAALLVARGSEWLYLKGRSEASNPIDVWRDADFEDAGWGGGDAPFRYGDGSGGTVLSDMRGDYTTLYLRRLFTVGDVALISRLDLEVNYDDGFTVWINGNEVLTVNAPSNPVFDSLADGNHESGAFESFNLVNPQGFLVEGENVLAIQVFNVSTSSSDLMMNAELVSTAPDNEAPVVLAFDPPPGNVRALSEITVTFSEPVTGVGAGDLLINDTPAVSVAGSGDRHTFTFAPGASGPVTVRWSPDHGIADTAVPANAFDATAPGEARGYTIVDDLAPFPTAIHPPVGATLRTFQEVTLTFSELVSGVDANDLLANGLPASSVNGSGAGPYQFTFPAGAAGDGAINISWAANHGIADLAAEPNAFEGGGWSYTLDPDSNFGGLVISEIMASNRSGLVDEDGEASDWIELHNFGGESVGLAGWSLSDDPERPGKWIFPARSLGPGQRIVVFASGKNRAPAGGTGELHASFKLAASGEFLGLFTPESPRAAADQLAPEFPVQRNDHSYARDSAGVWRYDASPSPGSANGDSTIAGLLPVPHVNVRRGFYNRPFDLVLTSPVDGATLRYTTDGSEPGPGAGRLYSSPIRITRTTVLRAAAFKTGHLPSQTLTQTYLYNLPSSQRSLPVISIVTDRDNLFGQTGIMETNPRNTTRRGIAWERPTSAELIRPEDNGGFQIDCGLRVQGGNYVRGRYDPNGGLPFSKYSFRLYFRGDYGPSTLEYPFFAGSEVREFDRIVLRAGMNDHSNPFIVDELVRRLLIDTGNVGSRGNFVNLFINGEYKGYYNPTERIDDDFMRSWHGGDNAWDVIAQFGEVREGDAIEWNRLRTLVTNRDQTVPANYQAVVDALDIDNYIDYLLVNIYAGTGDWPHNNWRAARERVPGAKFRFYVWDAEWALGNLGRPVTGNTLTSELARAADISDFFQALIQNPEFRLRFADRVQHHFFNGGALEDEKVLAHYEDMRATMSGVLPNMSTTIRTTWVPRRRAIIMDHLSNADLQHSDSAPVFSQHGGSVRPGYPLEITAPMGGAIYYTLDGSDPREPVTEENGGFSRTLLEESAPKRVLIPGPGNGGDSIALSWTGGSEPFNDGSWTLGTGGIGYDESPDYGPLIDIDVDGSMNDVNTSAYVRIPFTINAGDLDGANFMQLKVRYDDGFVAYLNGIRIASSNAPASPAWNSEATGNNSDTSAVNLRGFNISDFMDELREGGNVLAMHGLNDGLGSSDFLLSATIDVGENIAGGVAGSAIAYTDPIAIDGVVRAKSRVLRNGVWSALAEAEFYLGIDSPDLRITELMYNPDGGSAFEFVELFNAGSRPVDLGRMRFDGVGFAFQPGAAIQPGQRLLLISNDDPGAFAARYPSAVITGQFTGSLSNSGERLALLDPLERTLVSVDYRDSGAWPVEADGGGRSLVLIDPDGDPDDPANWTASAQPGGSPGAPDTLPPPSRPRISEIMADNIDSVPNGGAFPDWIELHNPGDTPVDLTGWGLSDDGELPHRFTFPFGTRIDPDGRMVIWCDGDNAAPGPHTGFALDRDGEVLMLTDKTGDRIDTVSFGPQVANLSVGLVGDTWQLIAPSPGEPNISTIDLAPRDQLAINEWLADPVPGGDDWLELFNHDATRPVALRGLYLRSEETTFRYGALAFIAPNGHLRLWADEKPGPNHIDFRLPAQGGRLSLINETGTEFEVVTRVRRNEGVSAGRLPDGSATITSFPDAASPGAANHTSSNPGLILHELLATSSDGSPDWLELRNTRRSPFPLGGFSLSIGSRSPGQWFLPDAMILEGGGHLAINCDNTRPPTSTPDDLNTGIPLPGAGDAVYLFDPAGREIDRVIYGAQVAGLSIGLDGGGGWKLLAKPTPGIPNTSASTLAAPTALRINEWLANSDPETEDFVELFNPSSQPVALEGLRLTEDLTITGINQYLIPALSFIDADGFLAFTADGSPSRGSGHLPFSLDADGETLRLHQSGGSLIIDEVTWGIEAPGVSSGRLPDGDVATLALAAPSPGRSNAADPATTDTDGDGMPDRWEQANGLDPNNEDDAMTDTDGDGRSNLSEFIANTDPRNPGSQFEISRATRQSSRATLEFTAQPGVRYTVEFHDQLDPARGDWQTLTTIDPSTTPRSTTITDPNPPSGNRFYRIVATRKP